MRLWRELQFERKQIKSCRKNPPGTRISVICEITIGKFNKCSIENLGQQDLQARVCHGHYGAKLSRVECYNLIYPWRVRADEPVDT